MSVSVTIGGTTVNRVLDVSYNQKDENELGTAEITIANTPSNRNYEYGEEVVVERDGTEEYVGVVEKKPASGGRNLKLTITARDKRAGLHYEEVHRPFYEQTTGDVIIEAVQKRTKPRNPVLIDTGDDLSNWTSNVDRFRLADLPAQNLANKGDDVLIFYFREEANGSYTATLDPIPSTAAPGKQLLWFENRFLFNNDGSYFDGEVELRDNGGNSYVWDLGIPGGAETKTKRYTAEEASSDNAQLSGTNKLQYRFTINGVLPEPRAGFIDYSRTRPFSLKSRNAQVTAKPASVNDSGREITRRFDTTIMELIKQLTVEEGAVSYVGTNDNLNYEPAGNTNAPEDIDYDSTRVVDAEFNRDSTDIVNRVTVQGAGDLQVQQQSSSSINFYGVAPRDKPLVDESIQSLSELKDYGSGFLDKNAWDDTAIQFTIADDDYRQVTVGQTIDLDWDPQDLGGTFIVSSVEVGESGKVTIGMTGSNA